MDADELLQDVTGAPARDGGGRRPHPRDAAGLERAAGGGRRRSPRDRRFVARAAPARYSSTSSMFVAARARRCAAGRTCSRPPRAAPRRNQCRNCSPTRSFSSRASCGELDDLLGDALLLLERELDGRDRVGELGLRRLDAGDHDLLVGVEQVLDDHHRVVPLLDRLPVEVRGELRQRLRVVVDGDRHVLLRGARTRAPICSFSCVGNRATRATLTRAVSLRCIVSMRHEPTKPCADRRRSRARLPQLQRRLPRPRRRRGRRLHGDPDPEHRRPRLSGRARRRAIPGRDPDPARGRARADRARAARSTRSCSPTRTSRTST